MALLKDQHKKRGTLFVLIRALVTEKETDRLIYLDSDSHLGLLFIAPSFWPVFLFLQSTEHAYLAIFCYLEPPAPSCQVLNLASPHSIIHTFLSPSPTYSINTYAPAIAASKSYLLYSKQSSGAWLAKPRCVRRPGSAIEYTVRLR